MSNSLVSLEKQKRVRNTTSKTDQDIDPSLINLDAEQSLLALLLWSNSLYEKIADILMPEYFTISAHKELYERMRSLFNKGQSVDRITLKAFADATTSFNEWGNSAYLQALYEIAPFSGDIVEYATHLKDLYLRREIVRLTQETASGVMEVDMEESAVQHIESLEKELYSLALSGQSRESFKTFAQTIKESLDMVERAKKNRGSVVGITTGFPELNDHMGGLVRSDLLILAGRPSMGKTAFATNIAFNAAKAFMDGAPGGARVAFFSLEMSSEQLTTRILAQESKVRSDVIRKGKMNDKEGIAFQAAAREIEAIPLYIDDTPALSVSSLRTRARRLQRQKGLDLIVIDYLQLLMPGTFKRSDNRVQEVSDITRSLKALAKELNVPVLALSQLSRAVEQREDKKPMLSDLRESGSIEQDADVVMFVYRDEYYESRKKGAKNEEAPEINPIKKSNEGHHAEIILAKQRHGPIGTVNLVYFPSFTSFRSPARGEH